MNLSLSIMVLLSSSSQIPEQYLNQAMMSPFTIISNLSAILTFNNM